MSNLTVVIDEVKELECQGFGDVRFKKRFYLGSLENWA